MSSGLDETCKVAHGKLSGYGMPVAPDLCWLHDVGGAVRALHAELILNGARPPLRLLWRYEAVHDHVCAGLGQALQHAEAYALRGACSTQALVTLRLHDLGFHAEYLAGSGKER